MYHFQVQKMTHMQLWMISFFRSYENCRCPGVAILDMQMSKVPIISGYGLHARIVHPKWSFDQSNPAWRWRNVNCGRFMGRRARIGGGVWLQCVC